MLTINGRENEHIDHVVHVRQFASHIWFDNRDYFKKTSLQKQKKSITPMQNVC